MKASNSVMGVRGTSFLAAADKSTGASTLHVLQGTVAMAPSIAELIEATGLPPRP